MFQIIRTVLLATLGLVTALFAGIVGSPTAVAPEQTPPAVLEISASPATTTEVAILDISLTGTSTKPKTQEKPIAVKPKEDPETLTVQLEDAILSLNKTLSNLTSSAPLPSNASLNDTVRGSIVNILCTTTAAGPLNSISASGVMIDPRGVVITNAHVGQYFLLKDYPTANFVECIVRNGSPATAKYKAELLFLPPSWIAQNAEKVDDESPTGNGEHDYALLRITGPTGPGITMPEKHPFLPVSIDQPIPGSKALIAGYPAGFLGGITVQKDLYSASSLTSIGELFTFNADTIDLFSIGGSVVAQQGSSGGAVANEEGILEGLIVTSSQAESTGARDLRAISTSYIVRDFATEAGISIESFLSADLATRASTFNRTVAPTLTKALTNVLDQ